jgi:hypothetical protein
MTTTEQRTHQAIWALLPWMANGSANTDQRKRAETHLASCADCRAELTRERRLAAAMALPSVPGPDLSQGLARLMQRLDHAAPVRAARPWFVPGGGGGARGPVIRLSTAAMLGAVQLALVAAAAAWWPNASAPGAPNPGYQTLTQAPSAAGVTPGLRVVFQDDQPVGALQSLLVGHGLVIVSGPSDAGVFSLGLADGQSPRDLDALAAALRRSPAVVFAEATGPAASR